MDSQPRPFDLNDYFRVVRKRSGMIVLILLSAMTLGLLFSAFAPKRYKASSTVKVETTPTQLIIWGGQGDRGSTPHSVSLETQAKLVMTSVVAAKAVEWLMDPKRPDDEKIPEATAQDMLKTLSVSVEKPDLVNISSTCVQEPDKAKMYAIAAAEGLVAYSKATAVEHVELTREFLEKQVTEARGELDERAEALAAHQRRSGVVDVRTEAEHVITGLSAFRQMRDEAVVTAREHESLLASLQGRLAREEPVRSVPALADNPEYGELQRELARKQVELYEAQSKYTEGHPAVANLRADVEALRAALSRFESPTVERRTLAENPLYRELEARVVEEEAMAAGSKARVAAIENAIQRQAVRKERLPKDQLEQGTLHEELDVARDTYRRLLENLKDVQIEEASQKSPAKIVNWPTDSSDISLSRRTTVLFSLFIGVVVAIGVVLVLEFTDTAIRDADDITRETGVPVLGVIPFRRDAQLQAMTLAGLGLGEDARREGPYSAHAGEAYRTLRSNITFTTADNPVQSLLITSAGVGEGKSLTAANLAVVMAQAGLKVLLVDTDLRRPRLWEYFGAEERDAPGLTTVLGGHRPLEQVLLTPDEENLPQLQVLTSGAIPPNPAELLASDRMMELIEQMKERADHVIMDSPPAMMLTDAAVLAGRVDGVLLLVEAGKVPKAVFADMCGLVRRAHGRIIGAVINKRKYQAGDYYYYYHYYEDTTDTPTSSGPPTGSEADAERDG